MIYAISDLHGHLEKYREMLEQIEFTSEDTLYVLGDVIDRGPDGIPILQDMMFRSNVFPLLGNHEFTAAVCLPWLMEKVTDQSLDALDESQIAALSEWIANGGGVTLQSLQQLSVEERMDILEYFHEMELFAEVEAGGRSFVLTHSGLENFSPDRPLSDYTLEEFLFCRPTLETVYFPDRLLVFGHTPTRFLSGQDKILHRKTWVDIDCGCAASTGRLGCLCLDTMEEFYV